MSEDKLKLKCERCGRVFFVAREDGFKKLCFPCYALERDGRPRKVYGNANSQSDCGFTGDGGRVESGQPDCRVNEKPLGFDGEARLLEACWRRVHDFEPVPTGEQATSLAASLFISLSKTAHIREMRR